MTLPVQTFSQIVNAQSAAVQANSLPKLNFNVGSVLLALIEANAANSIWLQALASTVLATTRLSTSTGTDVDTFIADFGFARYPGNPASGNVVFSRFTPTVQGIVPVGTVISDSANNLTFTVSLNTSNPNYDASLNAYVVAISTSSMTVPATCTVLGTIGNVVPGSIDTINNQASTPGIDTVTNSAAFTNGANPWSDSQTQQYFALYINSLSRATLQAIEFAVSTTTNGSEIVARYNIVENYNESGAQQLGYFYVIIDNGTGSTVSMALLNAVSANVELYRGLTIQYQVSAATFISVAIVVSVYLIPNPTETQAVITANITAALQAYAASIPFNQPFLYSKIGEIVYDSDPNILSIPSSNPPTVAFNGGPASNADGVGNNLQVFGVPTVTVNYL